MPRIKRGSLWLLTASSWVALIEPSPYEISSCSSCSSSR
jgi:hypothetical protein